jgi:hypothetical protein
LCCLALAVATLGLASPSASAASHASVDHLSGTAATSGSPSQPQLPSNADFSGHGANVTGPYNSTRNGAPSLNGNGNGAAVGKPCAGCVGKADNKNPAGQMPNGSDHNAGYECDRNHGIGRTNPAHTGCTSAATTSSTSPPTTSQTTSTTVANTSKSSVANTTSTTAGHTTQPPAGTSTGTGTGTGFGLTAGSDDTTSAGLTTLQGSGLPGQSAAPNASPATATRTNSGRLAFTGTDTIALLIAALLSVGAGAVFVAYSRHRRAAAGH